MNKDELMQKTIAAKNRMRANFAAMGTMAPMIVASEVKANAGDADLNRVLASKASAFTAILPDDGIRNWEEGMTTQPGDIVYDPDRAYAYIYTGTTPMTHSNALFYPGAAGVYYWAIIPNTIDGVKVYPDISGIIVAVKHGEIWWNTDKTAMYSWNGADNNACVWPPVDGNEWTKVSSTEE